MEIRQWDMSAVGRLQRCTVIEGQLMLVLTDITHQHQVNISLLTVDQ